ncbi:hypothetical protein XELAEV_18022354mg [Xenopus laevis]|uniref:Uncharacterized protein n=1 Tax=Xenopus laevis TaxID=8355 RepID=A0A974HNL3_XENLA|nr:hypothetical protein XELAEV_18022354mg [Xenopus laevis]
MTSLETSYGDITHSKSFLHNLWEANIIGRGVTTRGTRGAIAPGSAPSRPSGRCTDAKVHRKTASGGGVLAARPTAGPDCPIVESSAQFAEMNNLPPIEIAER